VILLWGVPGDQPLDYVSAALARRDSHAFLLDQRRTRRPVIANDGAVSAVETTEGEVDLGQCGAAYIRPQETTPESAAVDAALVAWADFSAAGVVNRPGAMCSNYSKPYQLALIAGYGFVVPDTIVTTDPSEVRRFWRHHGQVIYKSVSGVRSIVSQLRDEHVGRLSDVVNAPTQFQEYIPGDDVRVHVVGNCVMATQVSSAADDYRYASRQGADLELVEVTLPAEIIGRCLDMVHGMQLHLAGVDLRRTPDGRWVCFEVNPSPAFTFYEEATGQPISDAIADLLMRLDESASKASDS
jgi:glutathione synthase/RimK-type ligase-like ATP-grasp enzyme